MGSSLLSIRINWFYLLGGALLWSCFYAVMLHDVFDLAIGFAAIDSFIANSILLVSVFVAFNALRFYQPSADRIWFMLAAVIILSTLVVLAEQFALAMIFSNQVDQDFFEQTLLLRVGFALLGNAAAIGVGFQWYNINEQQEIQERKESIERMSKEAELFKLRHQLQPHFLFNSLNSINALITIEPQQARTMVQQLSAFLRGTIRGEDQTTVTLKEELEYLSLYLAIEQVRFGHRLATQITADDESNQAKLPPLLLQPLMENAIKFGLYGTTGDVRITLVASLKNGMLEVSISNPVDDDVETQRGTGFGLKAIKRRLFLIFGRTDLLETVKSTSEFKATLKIPQL